MPAESRPMATDLPATACRLLVAMEAAFPAGISLSSTIGALPHPNACAQTTPPPSTSSSLRLRAMPSSVPQGHLPRALWTPGDAVNTQFICAARRGHVRTAPRPPPALSLRPAPPEV